MAWQNLHKHYEPSLAARQGAVLADFSNLVTKPAKGPLETKQRITEMDARAKVVEDITGKPVDDNHAKSVLIGLMDPTTRQHTVRADQSPALHCPLCLLLP